MLQTFRNIATTDVRGQVRRTLRYGALSVLGNWQQFTGAFPGIADQRLVQVLLLHQVDESQAARFRRLLQRLSEIYAFISYDEAVRRIQSGDIQRPYLTFSFDDGLASNLTAARILRDFGATACFFVCPPMLSETDPANIKLFCEQRLYIPATPFLTWADAEQLLDWGHEIGSHTMHHVMINKISFAELQEELSASRDQLIRRLGSVAHFAWPYGRFFHTDPYATCEIFRAGYSSCASGERGCHAPHDLNDLGRVCIHRDNCDPRWPVSHVLYFLARSARHPKQPWEVWPKGWPAFLDETSAACA